MDINPKQKEHFINFTIAAFFLAALYVLFNNVSKYQGWGGDYAGYIDQARSIVEGKDTRNPNYIYNPEVPSLAPPSYPMGFSVLLSPMYSVFGTDTLAYVKLMSVIWWLCGVSLFFFLKKKFPIFPSAFASLLFLFNPFYFAEKNGVLPDSFFTLCIIWALYFFIYPPPKDVKSALFCGAFAGFTIITRANGVALLLAMALSVLLEQVILMFKNKKFAFEKEGIKQFSWVLLSAVLVIAIVKLWLPGPPGGSYFDQLRFGNDFKYQVRDNFYLCLDTLKHFFGLPKEMPFMYKIEYDTSISSIAWIIASIFIVIGLLFTRERQSRLLLLFLLISTAVLSVWPMVQGFRYMLPLFPILIYFLLSGIEKLKLPILKHIAWLSFPILLLPNYYKIDKAIAYFYSKEEVGAPEFTNNQEAYTYINKNYPKSTIFGYHHPLILGLYADRKSVKWNRPDSPEQIWACFQKYKVEFIMINDWLLDNDKNLQEFLKKYAPKLEKQWSNERNTIYKLI
jgi:Dolichyl-phosphate-mannose-protein mannosyltransferase